jgi:hypothetical protein
MNEARDLTVSRHDPGAAIGIEGEVTHGIGGETALPAIGCPIPRFVGHDAAVKGREPKRARLIPLNAGEMLRPEILLPVQYLPGAAGSVEDAEPRGHPHLIRLHGEDIGHFVRIQFGHGRRFHEALLETVYAAPRDEPNGTAAKTDP